MNKQSPIALPEALDARWPLGLNREEAAHYIGVGTTKFDEMVADKRMPKPHLIDSRVVWDQEEVRLAFKALKRQDDKPKLNTVTAALNENPSS